MATFLALQTYKTELMGFLELKLVLSVAPAAAERKTAGADEDAPEVGTAGVGAVLNG